MASVCSWVYPSVKRAPGTVVFTILIMPPPTSFLYLISARSGSMPVVSQSIMKPIVPVGARTVTWLLRYPYFSPWARASSQVFFEASNKGVGTLVLFMLLTEARCIRITSRNGSRFMYHPGQAPPGMTLDPRLVSAKPFCVGSVAGTKAGHDSAIFEDCR